jgi:hypothetical protein
MKAIAIAVPLLFAAGDALAISRRDISKLSCEQTQALVRSQGAVILRFRSPRNPSAVLYDRFVSDGRYCGSSEQLTRASASAADNAYCPLRKCVDFEMFDLH